jgi:hypothetical protein
LHLYWGRGNNLESIFSSALWQIYQTLYLFFRMQECRPPSPQDAGMIVLSMGDGILTHLPQLSRPNILIVTTLQFGRVY